MHAPPHFRQSDPQAIKALLRAHPFAAIAVNGADGPQIAHAPLLPHYSEDGTLLSLSGHVSRTNPFWKAADGAACVAIFQGADAYVSPSYYPSKAAHGRVVPTWNYVRAEARGRVAVFEDRTRLRALVDALTSMLERERPAPWAVSDAPADYVDTMLGAIVGFEICAVSIEGAWKLSQNRNAADQEGARAGLVADGRADLAAWMPRK